MIQKLVTSCIHTRTTTHLIIVNRQFRQTLCVCGFVAIEQERGLGLHQGAALCKRFKKCTKIIHIPKQMSCIRTDNGCGMANLVGDLVEGLHKVGGIAITAVCEAQRACSRPHGVKRCGDSVPLRGRRG